MRRDLTPIPTGEPEVLTSLHDIRAVLFDLYGTLFLSSAGDLGLHENQEAARAFSDALNAAGLSPANPDPGAGLTAWKDLIREDHRVRRDKGEPCPEVDIRDIWRRFARDHCPGAPTASDDPAWSIAAVTYETTVNTVTPAPGAVELLAALDRRGLALGLVSNAQFYTRLLFDAYLGGPPDQLGFRPDLCVFSYELGAAKPSPAMFRGVLERLAGEGIEPGQVVYVGNDMLKDIATASRAGCRTILYAGDRRSLRTREEDARCAGIQPDAVITDLHQVEACL